MELGNVPLANYRVMLMSSSGTSLFFKQLARQTGEAPQLYPCGAPDICLINIPLHKLTERVFSFENACISMRLGPPSTLH